jgi:DNA polymerase sigma
MYTDLTPNQRKEIIVEFIINHQGCNIQKIVNDLKDSASRMTIFKCLHELKQEGIVRQEKAKLNSRDYKLYVDAGNPVVLVPKELAEFENIFFELLSTALSTYNKINKTDKYIVTRSIELSAGSIDLLNYPLHLFHDIVNVYNIHSIILWPTKVQDKTALKNLYFSVLMKISEIQVGIVNTFEALRPHLKESAKIILTSIFHDRLLVDQWKNYTNKMVRYYDFFNDFMWNISFPYRDYLYFDAELVKKNYKYEDGWRKLLEMTRDKK